MPQGKHSTLGRKGTMNGTKTYAATELPKAADNPWVTKEATVAKAQKLIHAALVEGKGWNEACADAGIKYSRGWLIVRYTEHVMEGGSAITGYNASEDKGTDTYNLFWAVAPLRTGLKRAQIEELTTNGKPLPQNGYSWGEIAVRTGCPESRVRTAWEAYAGMRSTGLRIGHGGRFVADRPDLYTENRKKEGAAIPFTKENKRSGSSVRVDELLNYVPKDDGTKAGKGKSQAHTKGIITKLRKKAADPAVTPEEAAAFNAKADQLEATLKG